MAKYHVLIRPMSDCLGITECDGYGNEVDLTGTFCINGEKQRFYARVDRNDKVGDFMPSHLELEENEVSEDMEFENDEAALKFVDWFDGCGFDPWRVDFVWAYDGNETAEREVYTM